MILLTMLLIPILVDIGFLCFGGKKFSLKKFALDIGVQTAVMGIFILCISWANTADTELLNGRVVSKTRDEVSCSHSYSCNCRQECETDSKGNEDCTTVCDTCYEHSYDVDWDIETSINHTITIDRVDRQGLEEPPRWSSVQIGEPISVTHSYSNFIKGAPDTLFRHQGLTEKFKDALPSYPQSVYDYYKVNRLVSVGVVVPDAAQWNKDLMELNAELGTRKQVNTVVVLVKNQPEDYFYALEQQWIGGKKNDVVLVVDVDDSDNIQWVNTMALTDNKIFQVTLRDSILGLKVLNRDKIIGELRSNIETNFVRKPMKDFEYLSRTVKPTKTQWIIAMVLGLVLSIGMGIYLENNDIFDEEPRRW